MDILQPLGIHPELRIENIDLFNGNRLSSLQKYFDICKKASDLLVTTSCFTEWKKGKSANASAKLIPAVPVGHAGRGQPVRVFFFDDNINLSMRGAVGAPDAKGICNLRDVITGNYVDFSVGRNGFVCDSAYRHTLIHHSSQYNTVLVQANILDAMSNVDYFSTIIEKYHEKGEKLIVFMDVNGTILWSDSIMGQGPNEILLGTMFGFAEVRPREPFDLSWESHPPVRVDRNMVLKQLMHDIARGDNDALHDFWLRPSGERFMNTLLKHADLGWVSHTSTFTVQEFFSVHNSYMESLQKQEQGKGGSGITTSWFTCLSMLQRGRHATVINSFGMDTHKVVLRSVRDPRRVPHMAVNFESWSERDTTKFRQQFEEALPEPSSQRFMDCSFDDILACRTMQYQGEDDSMIPNRPMEVEIPDYLFIYALRKPSVDVSLGAQVTHVDAGLQVMWIVPRGAIESANEDSKNSTPPGEVIRAGDIIRVVNDISGDTKAMVEECRRSTNVNLVVARPTRPSSPAGFCTGGNQACRLGCVICRQGLRWPWRPPTPPASGAHDKVV